MKRVPGRVDGSCTTSSPVRNTAAQNTRSRCVRCTATRQYLYGRGTRGSSHVRTWSESSTVTGSSASRRVSSVVLPAPGMPARTTSERGFTRTAVVFVFNTAVMF